MFSGIVEAMAEVVAIRSDRQNKDFTLRSPFAEALKIDQSVSHNGVCLTVVAIEGDCYTVTAMKETLDKSNLGLLQVGDKVNVERSMRPEALLDGHIVQGHVDHVHRLLIALRDRNDPVICMELTVFHGRPAGDDLYDFCGTVISRRENRADPAERKTHIDVEIFFCFRRHVFCVGVIKSRQRIQINFDNCQR